jgi:hypothetical protein
MTLQAVFKKCQIENCPEQINARLSINVCKIHHHNLICNCRSCRRARARLVPKTAHSNISLVPPPWLDKPEGAEATN